MAHRRQLALLFFRQLKPLLKKIDHAYISHRDGLTNPDVLEKRGISLRNALHLENAQQQLGFEIRLRRLQLRMTQKDLAKETRLTRPQISDIERGKCRPRPYTLKMLEWALGARRGDLPYDYAAGALPAKKPDPEKPDLNPTIGHAVGNRGRNDHSPRSPLKRGT